ncbi:glycoside hydrolase/deacetylase [Hesseltinella vesiculosa]|uniref:chitin deacetylase n=1 Tax=Hesseltinella vesiculosa TaxID=101127 RepID=A0A1X2GFX4_9FUNG|nr:glycoside hydrolase/deacetylase [Hesseltinella vesiculosa]
MWNVQMLALVGMVGYAAADVKTNYTSSVDPTKLTIPNIPQTTSHDVATQCQYYQPPVAYNPGDWPTSWQIATSNGMNTSAEFTALYNSIQWANAPNIQPRQLAPTGGLVLPGYDTVNDPDCWWSATQCTKPKHSGVNADIVQCQEPGVWGLTFDDGPNCSHNAFYDFLKQNNQRASMFYIGSNVMGWPYGAMRGLKDGHHLAGHTWSHKLMTTLTNQEVLAELYYTSKAIKFVTGVTPKYWRPAQGDLDDRVRWIASQLGLTAILWNLDTDDWAANTLPGVTTQSVQQNYQNFIAMGGNGSFSNIGNIVLTHEINNMTMDFAVQNYPAIKKAYKHVLDVATCMNISHPYIEESITYPSFDQAINQNASTATGSGVSPAASGTSFGTHSATVSAGALFIATVFGVLATL